MTRFALAVGVVLASCARFGAEAEVVPPAPAPDAGGPPAPVEGGPPIVVQDGAAPTDGAAEAFCAKTLLCDLFERKAVDDGTWSDVLVTPDMSATLDIVPGNGSSVLKAELVQNRTGAASALVVERALKPFAGMTIDFKMSVSATGLSAVTGAANFVTFRCLPDNDDDREGGFDLELQAQRLYFTGGFGDEENFKTPGPTLGDWHSYRVTLTADGAFHMVVDGAPPAGSPGGMFTKILTAKECRLQLGAASSSGTSAAIATFDDVRVF